jgi:hypothetical protein
MNRKQVPALVPSANTEKPKASKKRTGPYNIPKYFDSPEGKSFISATVKSDQANTKSSASPTTVELSVVKPDESIKELEGDINLPLKEASEQALTVNASISTTESFAVIPEAAPQPIQEIAEAQPNKKTTEQRLKPQVKKERKLDLPAAILGEKPGVIPNSSYINREADVRRQINTVSTAQSRRQNVNYGSAGFIVRPPIVQFGNIDVSTARKPSFSFVMTNIGLDSGRFKIKQSPNSAVLVDYKHGPVAPGMAVTFTCTLKNHAELKPDTKIEEEIRIVSEMEILHVPLKGLVIKSKPTSAD